MTTYVSYMMQGEIPRVCTNKIPTFVVIPTKDKYECVSVSGCYVYGTPIKFYNTRSPWSLNKKITSPLILTDIMRTMLRGVINILPTKYSRLMVQDYHQEPVMDGSICLVMFVSIIGSDEEQVCKTDEIIEI